MKSIFVIYGVPRVGSNYLISLLNKHSKIICHYELFHQNAIFTGFDDKNQTNLDLSFINKKDRDQNPLQFLDRIIDTAGEFDAVGYNLFPLQNNIVLKHSLVDTGHKAIILKRRDVVRNYISWKIAKKTGGWNSQKEKLGKVSDKRVKFDAKEFVRRLKSHNEYYSFIENILAITGQESCTLYYEEFIDDARSKVGELQKYLGVSQMDIEPISTFKKQNKEPLIELVTNYSDMVKFYNDYIDDYCGCRHGWLNSLRCKA